MFWSFFEDYKQIRRDCAWARIKSLPLWSRVYAVVGIIIGVAILICCALGKVKATGRLMVLAIVWSIVLTVWCSRPKKKTGNQDMECYKQETYKKLKELLRDEKYNFDSLEGVDWLILSCQDELTAGARTYGIAGSFSKYVVPVITMFVGAVVDSVSAEIAIGWVALAVIIWFVICVVRFSLADAIEYIKFPAKRGLLDLKSDLQYLRLELKIHQGTTQT